ncbi:MAG: ORC1-type DNA replication protein, partial [Candidatus Syntropharchaeia archaeon]
IFIYGKTGTGKTATVKYVGRELEKTGETRRKACFVLYLNCEVIDTQYRVLANLARLFDREIPMTGWPTDQVYAEFKAAIDEEEKTIVIILDEVDKLVKKGDEVLYNLSRMNSELENARVSMIGISNGITFREYLDARVKSSLGEEEIVFPPYDANQLRDILEQRAGLAFKEGVLEENVIPLCAAYAAHEHGDARRALDLLRVAGEIAELKEERRVREHHVREAYRKIESTRIVEVIRTLPIQSKLVLYASVLLEKNNRRNFTTGEVYDVYKRLCRQIYVDSLTQRRITDLISELDTLGIINARVISKGRYGRTKEISLEVPVDVVKSILLEDYRLKPLADVKPVIQTSLWV